MLDRWLPTDESWKNHSWRTVYLVILLTTLLLLLDVLADLMKWFSVSHLIIETLAVVLLVGLLFWLQWQLLRSRGEVLSWQGKAEVAAQEASHFRQANQALLTGLSQAIDEQLQNWSFTQAEKDIGLLLLKGLSFKEIAELRQTSERTVRQQAGEVYRKSGLGGRNEFAAFFLEDLLLPNPAPAAFQSTETPTN
ncbi:MAG: helix-turn-helix transcriptional regulator [bacterium]|jgi:DNA-binding CsgD family transcriptional regulator